MRSFTASGTAIWPLRALYEVDEEHGCAPHSTLVSGFSFDPGKHVVMSLCSADTR